MVYTGLLGLLVFGLIRRNQEDSRLAQSSVQSLVPVPASKADAAVAKMNKHEVARVVYKVQQKLKPGEHITQVFDVTHVVRGEGVQYTLDVAVFDSNSTQALTKRIVCEHRNGSVTIISQEMISPVASNAEELYTAEDPLDSTMVDGEYALVGSETPLPLEPRAPRNMDCTLGSVSDSVECTAYRGRMEAYSRQVQEIRERGSFSVEREVLFQPVGAPVDDKSRFAFPHPRGYGYAAEEQAPIDYSVLSGLQPLPDEQFFNTVALEKSTLALQY